MRRARTSGRSGVQDGSSRAALPILSGLESGDGFPHSCIHALDVATVTAFGVMAYQNGLAEGNTLQNRIHGLVSAFGFFAAVFAIAFEAFAAFLGALYKGLVFVVDLTAKFQQQILAAWCPHGSDEKLLLWCPLEPDSLHAVVQVFIEAAGAVEAKFVVFGGIRCGHAHGVGSFASAFAFARPRRTRHVHAERLLAKAGVAKGNGEGYPHPCSESKAETERGVAKRRSAQAEGAEDWGRPLPCAIGAAPLSEVCSPMGARSARNCEGGSCGRERPAEVGRGRRVTAGARADAPALHRLNYSF